MTMNKLSHCKTCDAMIAKTASKCPQCGAVKSTAARWVAIAVVGMVLALITWATWIKPLLEKGDGLDEIERQIRAGETPRAR
jgi:hypothetical protein